MAIDFTNFLGLAGTDAGRNVGDLFKWGGKHSSSTPYYWAKAQEGNMSPQNLPMGGGGYFPETGFGGAIEGIDPYYKKSAYDVSAPIPTYKYGRGSTPRWREGWYEPYYNSMVRAQLREKIGMGTQAIAGDPEAPQSDAYGGLIDSSKSKFMKLSEANLPQNLLSRAQQLGITQPGQATLAAGFDEPLIAKGSEFELTQAGDLFVGAERAYQDVLDAIELKETTAFEEKEGALEQIRTERLRSQRDVIPAQEQARAAQAATGMAYSAPAERISEDVEQATLESKLDFKGAELEAGESYEDLMEGYEQERRIEEGKFETEKERFETSLGGVMQKTATEAAKTADLGQQVMEGHRDYGASLVRGKRGKIVGGSDYGGGIGGGELWKEATSPEADLLEGVAGEAESFAQQLEIASANLFQDLGLDRPVDTGGETY
tara:strand:- start:1400 stop:2695 length:1296 start_codon:yes stop_codon:yes gene_type:complete